MKKIFILFSSVLLFISCSSSKKFSGSSDEIVNFSILQFNDFYEIAPLKNGTIGGAARMATLRKKLLAENPNLLTVLAGDFISPSLLGTLKFEGESIKGKHIVEVLNSVGIDLVTFGNHEFDYDRQSLQKRINESKFDWVSTNVLEVNNDKKDVFYKETNGVKTAIPKSKTIRFKNAKGATVNIGVVAPCIDDNIPSYVTFEDIKESLARELSKIQKSSDFIISLSHLEKAQDQQTARDFPILNLILGGHEHENMYYKIGQTILTKADANARSAYIHRISYNVKGKKFNIKSELVPLDSHIALDPETNMVVQKWKDIEARTIRNMGFSMESDIPGKDFNYDARSNTIRNEPSLFPQMICRAITSQCKTCSASIINSGCIRIDDIIEGTISQYDILRSLPYGGEVTEFDIKGSLLNQVLDMGWKNKGEGGFLQWDNIDRTKEGKWLLKNKIIDESNSYHIMMVDFVFNGNEKNLKFLSKDNPGISNIVQPAKDDIRGDIRMMVIDYLKKGGR